MKKELVPTTVNIEGNWYIQVSQCPHCKETLIIVPMVLIRYCPYCGKKVDSKHMVQPNVTIKLRRKK